MSKKLQKSLQEYISKIKKQTPHLQFSHSSLSSTTSKIISGCKHPKSLSFSGDRRHKIHHDDDPSATAATLEDIDNFLIENFKSLYGGKDRDYHQNDEYDEPNSSNNNSHGFFTPPRDLCGSNRFFVSSTSSSSLVEEAVMTNTTEDDGGGSTSTTTSTPRATGRHHDNDGDDNINTDKSAIPPGIEDCIALLTVSPSPYEDFRKSMKEMLDARIKNKQRVDWDFMEELLFCYLRLNEKKQYRYILSAFVDLVVVLRQNSRN